MLFTIYLIVNCGWVLNLAFAFRYISLVQGLHLKTFLNWKTQLALFLLGSLISLINPALATMSLTDRQVCHNALHEVNAQLQMK